MAVVIVLSLATFLVFRYVDFNQNSTEKWSIDGVLLIGLYIQGLMAIWGVVAIWVFYPLLASWRGRFVVLSGCAVLFLILMPISYESQLSTLLSTLLEQTPLPEGWRGENFLSTTGHFLAFFGMSLITLSLFRQQFIGVFVLLLSVALLSELLQNFAIGRSANLEDFKVDTIGVFVSGDLVNLFYRPKVSTIRKDACKAYFDFCHSMRLLT